MLTLGSFAEAAPQLFASQYNRCTSTPLDLTVLPGGLFGFRMYVSGQQAPVHRYTITTTLCAVDGGALPDAWRVDVGGCQPSGSPSP